MAQIVSNLVRCFLCRRKYPSSKCHRNVATTKCTVSQKSLKDVIMHLASKSNTQLHVPVNERVCYDCHCQLLEYDSIIVNLWRTQRNLVKLVENAAGGIDSDLENECVEHMSNMEEFQNGKLFDDVHVTDKEITQTVEGVINNFRKDFEKDLKAPTKVTRQEKFKMKEHRERLQCNFCVMRFRSKLKLQKHTTQAHKKYTCEMCDFSHRNEDYITLHMNLHEGRTENQCRYCDKQFTTKISTIRHMEVHMNSKKYQCDKCGLCFSQTTVLYNHKLQHEAEEDPLKCEICNQVFKTKRTYRHHMITHQADRPRYSCEYCSKTFTEKYTLKVHKRTHDDTLPVAKETSHRDRPKTASAQVSTALPQDEARFNCIICEQTFTNKDQLNKHMEKDHDVILKSLTLTNFSQYEVVTTEPRRPCHICGHMFSTHSNLDYHLDKVHGIAPVQNF